ncbi:hypothetical protein PCPL58_4882 [Pseudomonas cerasi]|uniref:Uncharacterized protein n=1 Tax=Pseudomonas cerasi TaxID=1583341 RepID=A0A193SX05_9PSED|nr:hypothetical protein PCPL58_4882 [Pseudomonas cerasi]SOS23999.1 hypothetical protein PL963_04985 [Pseudomonas cerasi]
MLAKAIAQTPCFLRLHWPIREQARSHMTDALRGMHTSVIDDDMRPMLKRLALYTDFVGASLLAKAIGQTPCFLRLYWPIREQARSHRAGALRGMHTSVVDDDMRAHAKAPGVVHRFCGSELARESDWPDALLSVAALAYSRASSLPQGRCATGMHTGVVDDDMRPTLKRLALYTSLVGAISARRGNET